MSIPDPFDVEPAHITIYDAGRTPEEIVAELREKYPPRLALLEQTAEKLGAAKARISTLEALTDQLADAAGLIAEVDVDSYGDSWTGPDSTVWDQCHPTVQEVLDARTALRVYEADKKAHR